ncbi:MAG: hypothetical protein LBS30_03375 [Planctomycetota bacterium]|jgi:hypothetical protein|nr:hypothetical protein [Planctomycetota bacterium]
MRDNWKWKNKDGAQGGLLYEPGNWGDFLKMLWLRAVLEWKTGVLRHVAYFDPFAGDVEYPLGAKTRFRIEQTALREFAFLRSAFLDRGFWPSAASGARLIASGGVEVWDADSGRRDNWRRAEGVSVPGEGESGWRLLRDHADDPGAVWLIDPYDFLAEWRDVLRLVAEKSRATTLLLYVYNRSAKNAEAFREYRACKNALEDLRGDLPKRIGRAAADVFLPRAHHEMWFLPGEEDAAAPGFDDLLAGLAETALSLERGMRRCGVCDA